MKNKDYLVDHYRLCGGGTHHYLVDFTFRHGVRFTYYYRKYRRSRTALTRSWYRFLLYRLSRKYGLEVSPNADIGVGLYLCHPYNITIGNGVVIGKNCTLYKGCTLGVAYRGKRMGAPTLGNCVFVGINAIVVGNVRIGDDVLIAPGAYVNFDVPSHSIVIGNPGRIIPKENATEGCIFNKI